MLPHFLVKNNSSDAACRIVDRIVDVLCVYTTHQPALVRATHLLPRKNIITSVNWTLQTRHTVDRCDIDTYFVMYRWSKTYSNCYTQQT